MSEGPPGRPEPAGGTDRRHPAAVRRPCPGTVPASTPARPRRSRHRPTSPSSRRIRLPMSGQADGEPETPARALRNAIRRPGELTPTAPSPSWSGWLRRSGPEGQGRAERPRPVETIRCEPPTARSVTSPTTAGAVGPCRMVGPLRPTRRASCSGRRARRSSGWRRSRRRTPPSPRRCGRACGAGRRGWRATRGSP